MLDRDDLAAAIARLDSADFEAARWFAGKGRPIERVELDEAFALDAEGHHTLAIVSVRLQGGEHQRYQVPLIGVPPRPAEPGDGTWRALGAAMAEGRVIAAMTAREGASPRAALVCRPGPAMAPGIDEATERDLGADQSNTSVVLDDAVLVKAYRRLQPGLNPDLELTAFLSEEAGFTAVPPLAGYVELVETGGTTTLAMAQQYIRDGADAYEAVAEALTAWLRAPGTVSLEVATEIAADVGALTAGLHAALADGRGLPDMAPRPATRDELRAWSRGARANLDRALDVAPPGEAATTLRDLAPRIAEALTVLAALPSAPEVIRAHGDYHLGQVLIAADGYRIVDFEGEPLSTPEERRAHRHPLRDVASMLRSIDHVAGSAARRAASGTEDEPPAATGLDLPGWRRRARERFLEAYRTGLSEARVWVDQDPALLLAFEVDKELYEFAYAATYLPSWLWAPTEGIRGLLEEGA